MRAGTGKQETTNDENTKTEKMKENRREDERKEEGESAEMVMWNWMSRMTMRGVWCVLGEYLSENRREGDEVGNF